MLAFLLPYVPSSWAADLHLLPPPCLQGPPRVTLVDLAHATWDASVEHRQLELGVLQSTLESWMSHPASVATALHAQL